GGTLREAWRAPGRGARGGREPAGRRADDSRVRAAVLRHHHRAQAVREDGAPDSRPLPPSTPRARATRRRAGLDELVGPRPTHADDGERGGEGNTGRGGTHDRDCCEGGEHRIKRRFTRRMSVTPARGMRPGGRAPLPRVGPARPDVVGAVRRRGPEHGPRPGVDHGREPTTTVPFHREVRTMSRASRWLAASFLLAACGGAPQAGTESGAALAREEVRAAAEAIDADQLLARISTLASDEFEGRAPGTVGEERTVEYLVNAFRELGLQPGNPNGTYTQEVSLIGYRAQPTASFTVAGRTIPLSFPSDFVAWTQHFDEPALSLTGSEIVLVGYGVAAPEYDWDAYKDVDVRGKTILMLVNDPAVPDPADPSRLDPNVFRGEAMTYYGRWTYKYEIASEKGAAAAIIVHETGPAGYPWEVVAGSWGGE